MSILKFSPTKTILHKKVFKFHTLDLLLSETRTFLKTELHGWTAPLIMCIINHTSVESMLDVTDFGHASEVRQNIYLRKTLYFMLRDTMRQRIFNTVPLINTFKLKNTFSFS